MDLPYHFKSGSYRVWNKSFQHRNSNLPLEPGPLGLSALLPPAGLGVGRDPAFAVERNLGSRLPEPTSASAHHLDLNQILLKEKKLRL